MDWVLRRDERTNPKQIHMTNDKQFNLVAELAEMQKNEMRKHNIHFVTIPKPKGINLEKTKKK